MEDIFRFGQDPAQIDSLVVAVFDGPSKVNGKTCDHLAFRTPKLDWQLWVSTDKDPLPCKLVITTSDDSSRPENEATYTWNLNPTIGTDELCCCWPTVIMNSKSKTMIKPN